MGNITDVQQVYGFGEGGFGEGGFGGTLPLNNITDVQDNWYNYGVKIGEESNIYKLMSGLVSEYYHIDINLEEIYRNSYLNNARGKTLDRIGEIVNCRRELSELDDRYRKRIKIYGAKTIAKTTYNDFARIVLDILGCDKDQVEIFNDFTRADSTAFVHTYKSIIDESYFTKSEITDLLLDVVPAGHTVIIETYGEFRLDSQDYTPAPDTGLVSDTDTTGGDIRGS